MSYIEHNAKYASDVAGFPEAIRLVQNPKNWLPHAPAPVGGTPCSEPMSANGLGFGIGRMCVSKHYDAMYARRYDTMFARRWDGITLRSLCAWAEEQA